MKKFLFRARHKCIYFWLRVVCRYSTFWARMYADLGMIPWGDEKFHPCMHYDECMNMLVITFADVSYRAVWTGTDVELLMHPHTETIVGVKIFGWKELLAHTKR